MPFTRMTTSVSNHQAIVGDDPGLDAAGFKALLDKAAEDIVTYLAALCVELEENTAGVSAAERLGSAAISGVTGTTVRAQIADLKTQITAMVLGTIPDGSITAAKMAADMTKDASGGILAYDTFLSNANISTKRDINTANTITMGGLL